MIFQIIEREDWIPGDKAKICAMHFAPECYREATGMYISLGMFVYVVYHTFSLFSASAVKRLNATAVPSLNLILEPLPYGQTKTATSRIRNLSGGAASSSTASQNYVHNMADQPLVDVDYEHEKSQYGLKDLATGIESRKRISNIIIVDLTKDKKAKFSEKPKVIRSLKIF